jgi:hypothetical protein
MTMKQQLSQINIFPNITTNLGRNVKEISFSQPVMLLFLRNFGCTFCRQTLSDISKQRTEIADSGVLPILIHLNSEDIAIDYLERYGLSDIERVEDTEMRLYADFGLTKGNFNQLFGLQNWISGFNSAVLKGHGIRPPIGDGLQMPGVFFVKEGEIIEKFIHESASDRPNYAELAKSVMVQ